MRPRSFLNWFVLGVLATLCFAFFGLFSKFSTTAYPLLSSVVICATSGVSGTLISYAMQRRLLFSKEAFFSGICSASAIVILIYLLASNQLLVVFSFVAFASVVFFVVLLILEKPMLTRKQKCIAALGILVATFGLFLASTSAAGGVTSLLRNSPVNLSFFLIAPIIPLGSGLWAYFSYVAIKKFKVNVPTASLNYALGTLVVAITGYLIFGLSTPTYPSTRIENSFPFVAGVFIMVGVFFSYKSYEMTTGESRIEETIVSILANAEIVPLTSYRTSFWENSQRRASLAPSRSSLGSPF